MGQLKPPVVLKCKPTYNFQSIEFEAACGNQEDIEDALQLYSFLVNRLIEIAPEQTDSKRIAKKKEESKEELATKRQKEILDMYGIPYDKDITKKQAWELINFNKNQDD